MADSGETVALFFGGGWGGVRVRAGIIAVERVLKAKGIAGIVGAVGMCVFCGV